MALRLLLFAALVAGGCSVTGRDDHGWPRREGPTFRGDGREVQILHPLYERREDPRGRTTWYRPFYRRTDLPNGDVDVNVLGPVFRYRRSPPYVRWELFPALYYTARTEPEDERSWFFVAFPLLFLGSDDFLVFPLGGVARGLLGLDELLLVTPLYARFRQRDFTGHHVLFPFVSWGSDGRPGGRRRFWILPFYGRSRGRDGSINGFVLWPFYTYRRKGEQRGFFLFPFYGRNESPTLRDVVVLYPFYFRRENFLTGLVDVGVWPFWRNTGGSDDAFIRRYWPLHEFRRIDYTSTEIVAWPFWRRQYRDDGRLYQRYTWVPPFYRRIQTWNRKDRTVHEKRVVWPIGRWERYPDGMRESIYPVVLPFDSPTLRKNLSGVRPFFTLYRKRVTAGGARDVQMLFGLIQSRRTSKGSSFHVPLLYTRRSRPEEGHVRVLTGVLGWGRDSKGGYVRILWGIKIRG